MVVQIFLIALITLVILGMVLVLSMGRDSARKKHVLHVIQGQASSSPKASGPKNEKDKRRADLAKKLKDTKEEDLDSGKKKTTMSMMLEQAGLKISAKQYWLFSLVLMVVLVFVAKLMGQPPHILLGTAVIGFFGLPRFIIKKMAANRQKKFLEEFPDALEATVRLLRAGMPVGEAISMIAREFTGPVGEEMERIRDKQKIGVPLHEAALEATRRMPLTEMQMFATGLSIQAQTGSSLSEVLLNLSGVIRARFRLKRKIKALSSEAVASASIIGSLPILVALGMYFTNYEYLEVLFTTGTGKILVVIAISMMLFGIFVMKQMINFKV